VEMDDNLHECGTWTDDEILLETIENPSESEDKSQNKEEITFKVIIQ